MKLTPKTPMRLIALSMLLLLSQACTTRPPTNHIPRLLNHPQFPAARAAAPEWARDALTTINDLQRDLAKTSIK
jgi:hypothetical protein